MGEVSWLTQSWTHDAAISLTDVSSASSSHDPCTLIQRWLCLMLCGCGCTVLEIMNLSFVLLQRVSQYAIHLQGCVTGFPFFALQKDTVQLTIVHIHIHMHIHIHIQIHIHIHIHMHIHIHIHVRAGFPLRYSETYWASRPRSWLTWSFS